MKFCLFFFLMVSLLSLGGCAGSATVLEPSAQKLARTGTGVLLTVNLNTNGKVREDKQCHLDIVGEKGIFKLPLKRGQWDYALTLPSAKAEITKISCGPFYYYDLKNQGADFEVGVQDIKYLGVINFKLEADGNLEWGHATKNPVELQAHIRQAGLAQENVVVDLLNL